MAKKETMAKKGFFLLTVFLHFLLHKGVASGIVSCPDPFQLLSTGCYYFADAGQSWHYAQELCSKKSGSHLAIIDTETESIAIKESNLQTGDTWLGCNDISHDQVWQCPGSTTAYFNKPKSTSGGYWPWMSNEPSANEAQDCLLRTNTGEVKAFTCATSMRYICEYENAPTTTDGGTSSSQYMTTLPTTPYFVPEATEQKTTEPLIMHNVSQPFADEVSEESLMDVTTLPLLPDIDMTLLDVFLNDLYLIDSSLLAPGSVRETQLDLSTVLVDELPFSSGTMKRVESDTYVFLSASTADITYDYEVDYAIEDTTYRVTFPVETVSEFGASWMSVGTLKSEQQVQTTLLDTPGRPLAFGSRIISITIFDQARSAIEYNGDNTVKIVFALILMDSTQEQLYHRTPTCTYFTEQSVWSEEGCQLNAMLSNRSHVTCECNHLSSFAILMQVNELEITSHIRVLDCLTFIGISLSIICLILTLVIYGILRLYKNDRIIIHANLAASLLIVYFLLIISMSVGTKQKSGCTSFGVLIHYFFLVAFMWMLFEGLYLYLKVSPNLNIDLKLLICVPVAWGIPLLIAIITVAVRHKLYGNDSRTCFLPSEKGVIIAFLGPVCCILLINLIILLSTLRIFLKLKANKDKSEAARIKAGLRAMLILTPILGVTYIFGLLVNIPSTSVRIAFAYIYTILNSLQGVFIFITQCLMDEEVKKCVKQKFGRVGDEHSLSSRSTSTSQTT